MPGSAPQEQEQMSVSGSGPWTLRETWCQGSEVAQPCPLVRLEMFHHLPGSALQMVPSSLAHLLHQSTEGQGAISAIQLEPSRMESWGVREWEAVAHSEQALASSCWPHTSHTEGSSVSLSFPTWPGNFQHSFSHCLWNLLVRWNEGHPRVGGERGYMPMNGFSSPYPIMPSCPVWNGRSSASQPG